jgi:hypothetical protein
VAGPSTDWVSGVAVTATGDVGIAGAFSVTATVGGTLPVNATAGLDAVLARFTSTGSPSWATSFGGPGVDNAIDLATQGTDFLATGVVSSAVTIGGTSVGGAGGSDGFVVRAPNGSAAPTLQAVKVATGAENGVAAAISGRAAGFVVTGTIKGITAFGPSGNPVLSPAGPDAFLYAG